MNINKSNPHNKNITSNCILRKQMVTTSCSNFSNLEKSNRDSYQIYKSQTYFSYPISVAGISPGIRTLESTSLPYHPDHLENIFKQPLSCSTAASSPNIGAGVRGKGGGLIFFPMVTLTISVVTIITPITKKHFLKPRALNMIAYLIFLSDMVV